MNYISDTLIVGNECSICEKVHEEHKFVALIVTGIGVKARTKEMPAEDYEFAVVEDDEDTRNLSLCQPCFIAMMKELLNNFRPN